MQKKEIYAILRDYQSGRIDRDRAMDRLDLDTVMQLLALVREYGLEDDAPAYFQSDASRPHVKEFFDHE